MMTAYSLANVLLRPLRRLYDRRDEMLNRLRHAFIRNTQAK